MSPEIMIYHLLKTFKPFEIGFIWSLTRGEVESTDEGEVWTHTSRSYPTNPSDVLEERLQGILGLSTI